MGSVVEPFSVKATLMDSVVLNAIAAPAGSAEVRVTWREVAESTDTLAVPPVTLNTPMLATPEPMMVTVVPTGSGAEPAVRVKPGPRMPSTPQLPSRW